MKVHGDCAPSYTMVKKWMAAFKREDFSTDDAPRTGRPKTASTEETAKKMRDATRSDRRISVRELGDTLNLGPASVSQMINTQLKVRKVRNKWVPRTLTEDQKARRVELSSANLTILEANPDDFWRRFVTVDETWVHHHTQ